MRTLMTAMGLGGAALVLQGCGGGGGGGGGGDKPHSDTCLNKAVDLVSQSSTGGSITGTVVNGKGGPAEGTGTFKLDVVQKIDLEKFNLRMDITSGTVFGKGPSIPGATYNVKVQMIVNAGNKEVVAKYDLEPADPSTKLPSLKNCSKITSDKIPDPAKIAQAFKMFVLPILQEESKCGGNDGTVDSWKIDFDSAHPGGGIAPPIPAGDTIKISSVMKMDKDYLISEVNEHIEASGKDPSSGSQVSGTIDFNDTTTGATLGGPTDADLDYSSWGTCYPMTPPGNAIDSVFQPQDNTAATAVIDKVLLESAFRKIFFASMHTAPKSEDKNVVV